MKVITLTYTLTLAVVSFGQELPPPPPPVAIVTNPTGKITTIDKSIVEFPDEEAEYKGGVNALQKFIINEIKYPAQAINENIVGKVYLRFVVQKNGKVKNVQVVKGAHPLLDQEAIRLIEAMPKWIPAKKDGKKVSSMCLLPLNFTLN